MLLRAVTRGRCSIVSDGGASRRVSLWQCLRTGCRAFVDRLSSPSLLRQTTKQLDHIQALQADRRPPHFDPGLRAYYLRTDLTFGLSAGGSVGHVAGVLNALDAFTGLAIEDDSPKVIWMTTDLLPTVDETMCFGILYPGRRHWEHVERLALSANLAYRSRMDEEAGYGMIGMLYQRYSLNNYTGLRLAATRGVPLVIEFNGSETWIARNWSGAPLRYEPIAQRIESMNLKYADLVVVVSEAMREQAVELGARPERVLVNPNGVDPERYHPDIDGTPVRERLGLRSKTVVGFIGTFDRWHGAPVLVEAVAELLADRPELRDTLACVMVGDGPEFGLVQARVEALGLSGVVHLTGRVPQAEGPTHLAACDILASPHVPNPDGSAFFGSPTKLFEYLAMGRAVVASRLGQIGEVLSDNETAVLVEPGDVGALSSAIGRLVDDAALRARLGSAGRAQAEREHTWHRHTQRIVDRLASVLNDA